MTGNKVNFRFFEKFFEMFSFDHILPSTRLLIWMYERNTTNLHCTSLSEEEHLDVRNMSKDTIIKLKHYCKKCIFLGFVSLCIIIHSNKSNQPDESISQIYCSSFKYSSTCFGHPHAHHRELINCSSRLRFTVGT